MIRCIVAAAVAATLGAAWPNPVRAQVSVDILVVDSVTSRAVEGVVIELTTPSGERLWRGTSAGDGVVTVRIRPGEVVLTAALVGYRTVGPTAFTVERDVSVRVLLPPEPLSLDSLSISARATRPRTALERSGFVTRRERRRFGAFLDRAEIEQRNVTSPSQLLHRISGVRVATLLTGSPVVYMRSATRPQLSAAGVTAECGPRVFRDGIAVHDGGLGNPAPLDDLVQLGDIAAIEVYRSTAEVPPEFSMGASGCGAILIWTR